MESMGKTVQRVVVIATINPSATMSTDSVLWDVLLDTRGPFVLNVNTNFLTRNTILYHLTVLEYLL